MEEPTGARPTDAEFWGAIVEVVPRIINARMRGKESYQGKLDLIQEISLKTFKKLKDSKFLHGGKFSLLAYAGCAASFAFTDFMAERVAPYKVIKSAEATLATKNNRLYAACVSYALNPTLEKLQSVGFALVKYSKNKEIDASNTTPLQLTVFEPMVLEHVLYDSKRAFFDFEEAE